MQEKLIEHAKNIETRTSEKLEEVEQKTQDRLYEIQSRMNEEMSSQNGQITKIQQTCTKLSNQTATNKETIRQNQQFVATELESVKGELEHHSEEIIELQNTQGQLQQKMEEIETKTHTSDVTQVIRELQLGFGHHDATLTMPTFNAKYTSPMEYLEKLTKYIKKLEQRRGQKNVDFHDILENSLLEHSSRWWQMTKGNCQDLEDFKQKFLDKYWCQDTQRGLRRKLENTTYNPNGSSSRAEYFINCALKLSTLSPPLHESEIVNIMTEHYEPQVRDAKRVQNVRTIHEMEKLLNRLDIEDRNTRGARRNNQGNGNNQVHNNNHRNWDNERRRNNYNNGNAGQYNRNNGHQNQQDNQRRNGYDQNQRDNRDRYTGNRYNSYSQDNQRQDPARKQHYNQENRNNSSPNRRQHNGYPQDRENPSTFYNSRYKPSNEQENACRAIRLQQPPLNPDFIPNAPPAPSTTAKITSLN